MKPTARLSITLAALLTATLCACSSNVDDTGGAAELSSVADFREQACDSISGLTPGYLESAWAVEVLSDSTATSSERVAAMKLQSDQMSASTKRTQPYECAGATWDRYLAESYLDHALEVQSANGPR